jgi:hypothetical protein
MAPGGAIAAPHHHSSSISHGHAHGAPDLGDSRHHRGDAHSHAHDGASQDQASQGCCQLACHAGIVGEPAPLSERPPTRAASGRLVDIQVPDGVRSHIDKPPRRSA